MLGEFMMLFKPLVILIWQCTAILPPDCCIERGAIVPQKYPLYLYYHIYHPQE